MIPATLSGRSTKRLVADLKNARTKGDVERIAALEAILAKRGAQPVAELSA